MVSREHLEQQLHERQRQYDLLTQLITKLREASAIEDDIGAKFKQDHQIEKRESEREALNHEIVEIERLIENSQDESDKYKSPKHYLEHQIYSSYQFLSKIETSLRTQNQPNDELSEDTMVSKYREAISLYIRAYFRLCSRLQRSPEDRIKEIAAEFSESPSTDSQINTIPLDPSEIFTNLHGSRIINVRVSQLFRIADLLTRPESVKAQKFYEALTIRDKARRALNKKTSFKLGSLGTLKPAIGPLPKGPLSKVPLSNKYDKFWSPARPKFGLPTTETLNFIPYELTLSEELKSFHSEFESVLEPALSHSESITNSQISGHLRIYPAGIGVISLAITLEFVEAVHVEVVAQIAKNIEALLFVDPEGIKRPYDDLMLDIVDQVAKHLFTSEGYERRWRPPSTTYTVHDDHGLVPLDNVKELAHLMSLAPANHEDRQDLKFRVARALKLPYWLKEHVIAIAGEGVGLFFVGQIAGKDRAENVLTWLSETHELTSAAAYAQEAFAEEVEKIHDQRLLDDSWLETESPKLKYLESLLGTMQQVMRATASIRQHLHDQNTGILTSYAKDVWVYSNPVNRHRQSLESGLKYIRNWLIQNQKIESTATIVRLLEIVRNISEISPLFPARPLSKANEPPYQNELEERLLDQLIEIEKMLGKGDPDMWQGSDRHSRIFEELRLQLGI